MKILLAMLSSEPSSRYPSAANSPYAIGVTYIYSVLEKEGHEVRMVVSSNDDYETSDRKFFETYHAFHPDMVGFSVISGNRVSTFRTIEKLGMLETTPPIIMGGIHVSVMYEQIVKKYQHVIAVIGEGEITIVELIQALESNRELDTVKGIAFYRRGRVIVTEERELIQDLDSVPFPKHELFFDSEPERTAAMIFTSRGCPSRCSFCCLKIISRGKYRKRDVQKVFEEITFLKRKYPRIQYIKIQDDTFLLDNARIIELCKLIVQADLGLTFGCITRVKPISSEMFYWLKRAGFTSFEFGLETGSEKLLKSIHKNITRKDVIHLIEIMKPFDFTIHFLVMCGFPGEDDSTIRNTVSFIQSVQKEHYVRIIIVSKLEVFPGTEVYEIMKNAGAIDDDYWMTEKPVPHYTVEHSMDKLIEYENYVLDRTGIERIFTLRGFLHHFLHMPRSITGHLMGHREFIAHVVSWPVKLYLPGIYALMREAVTAFRGMKSSHSVSTKG